MTYLHVPPQYHYQMSHQNPALVGGCHCASNRYTIAALTPLDELVICHCHICQRLSGSASLPFINVPAMALQWERHESITEVHASEDATRTFCNRCGTPLTMVYHKDPEEVHLTCGSLDPDSGHTLRGRLRGGARTIFTVDKAWWEALAEEGGER